MSLLVVKDPQTPACMLLSDPMGLIAIIDEEGPEIFRSAHHTVMSAIIGQRIGMAVTHDVHAQGAHTEYFDEGLEHIRRPNFEHMFELTAMPDFDYVLRDIHVHDTPRNGQYKDRFTGRNTPIRSIPRTSRSSL